MSHYEQLFDQLDAAMSRLETRCDKIERRRRNLLASKATYAQQACYDSRGEIHPSLLPAQRTRRSYLPHRQPPPARSNSNGYPVRRNVHQPPPIAFPAGDQFEDQELRRIPNPCSFSSESHQLQFLPSEEPTHRDPPVLRQYVGFSIDDAPRMHSIMCGDPPKKCIRLRVSDYKPWPPTGWPMRPQPPPLHQPTCWDPPKQQEYSSHEPPTHVDPLDRGFVKFGPLPQPPLSQRFRSEVDEGRYGEVITHTHSPTQDGDEERCESEDSILDAELCDSKNSILETVGRKLMDRGLPSENRGSREGQDGRLEDQQVSSFDETYPPCSPDISKEKEEEALLDDVEEDGSTDEVKKVIASLNVVQVSSKHVVGNYGSKKGDGAYTGLPVIACVGEVPSMNHRSTSLDGSKGLVVGEGGTVSDLFKRVTLIPLCAFDPGIGVSFNPLRWFLVPTLRTRWILTVGELLRSPYILGFPNIWLSFDS